MIIPCSEITCPNVIIQTPLIMLILDPMLVLYQKVFHFAESEFRELRHTLELDFITQYDQLILKLGTIKLLSTQISVT